MRRGVTANKHSGGSNPKTNVQTQDERDAQSRQAHRGGTHLPFFWTSPLRMRPPFSTNFFALSHAPPVLDMDTAS